MLFDVASILQFLRITPLALLVIWNTFFEEEMVELLCFWHKTEKGIARKTEPRAKKNIYKVL